MRYLPVPRQDRQLARQQDVQYVVRPEPERRREPGLREYVDILRRRKWLVLAPLAIVLPLMTLYLVLKPSVYEATTTLLIESVEPKLLAIKVGMTLEQSENFYRTQYELIQSRAVAEQVVDTLDLQKRLPVADSPLMRRLKAIQVLPTRVARAAVRRLKNALGADTVSQTPPESTADGVSAQEEAIAQLQQALKVKPRVGTTLVDISLRGENPTEVARQVNTVAEVYVNQNLEKRREASKKAVAQLTEEDRELKKKIQQARAVLREFKERQNIVSNNANDGTRKLASLEDSYLKTTEKRKELETRIRELRDVYTHKNKDDMKKSLTFLLPPDLRSASSLPSLLNRYTTLQGMHANLSTKFGPKHPSVMKVTSEIEEVNRAIDEEIQRIINGFQAENRILLAQEQKLHSDMQTQKKAMIALDSNAMEYEELTRELEINKKLHEAVSNRLAEATLTESTEMNNIKLVELAARGTALSGKLQTMLLSLMVALGLGVGWALVAEFLDKRFKSVDEVEGYLGIPFLGVIPHYQTDRDKPVVLYAPESSAAEAYRTLRTWIQMTSDPAVRTLLLTSAVAGEGKSTTAANLALSFAQLGRRVVLIDADLRRPMGHRTFNVDNRQGLTDILAGGAVWRAVLQDTSMENLKLVPSGGTPHNPTELLSTKRLHTLLENLKNAFDLVIVDSPVVLSIPDVAILAPQVDWTVLVHYPARGDRDTVMEAKRILNRAGANLLGIVFNNVSQLEHKHYHMIPEETYRAEKPVRPRTNDASFVDMRPNETQDTWVSNVSDAHPSPEENNTNTPRTNS